MLTECAVRGRQRRYPASHVGPVPAGRHPSAVIAVRTARRAGRSGTLWGAIFGLYVTSSALGYASSYPTPAQRARIAATFGSDAGLTAITGPTHQLGTVAGFTAWRSLVVLSVVGAVWGLLTSTKLLRGEEDAGRWELLLAGQTTRRRATGQALVGLGAGPLALWAITAAVSITVGRSPKVDIGASSAMFFALSLIAAPAMFLAVGAFSSQLAATRRQAATYSGAALGICYGLRLLADASTRLNWLRWVTPLGWVEQLQPLTSPQPLALLPIAALVVVSIGGTLGFAGIRDVGTGVLPDQATATTRPARLSGPVGLTVRLIRVPTLGWVAGIAAMALLVGLVAKQAGNALTGSSGIGRVISRLGARGAGAQQYLGVAFLIIALLVTLVAASQLAATRSEEAEGRLDHLLVRPVSRTVWLAGRLSVTTAVLLISGLTAGFFAWLGTASQGDGVRLTRVLAAGVNVIPPALCVLGIGVLAMGVRPRTTIVVTYGLLAWSFLVEVVGGFGLMNHWLLDTSVFHQLAPAPAVNPNWTSAAALLAVGVLAAAVGVVRFRYRDLVGE